MRSQHTNGVLNPFIIINCIPTTTNKKNLWKDLENWYLSVQKKWIFSSKSPRKCHETFFKFSWHFLGYSHTPIFVAIFALKKMLFFRGHKDLSTTVGHKKCQMLRKEKKSKSGGRPPNLGPLFINCPQQLQKGLEQFTTGDNGSIGILDDFFLPLSR